MVRLFLSQLYQILVLLCEVRYLSDLGIGSISNIPKDVTDLEEVISLAMGEELQNSNLHGFL